MFPLLLALTAPADPAVHEQSAVPQMIRPLPPGPVRPSCPTWQHYFQATGPCAGPGRYPFALQPRVCPVGICAGCDVDGFNPEARIACKPWVKEFSSAAHIALPRFDADGHCVPGDGLVIYEGMRLTVDPDSGQYDVTFTATVPHMPVTLRLQLEFVSPDRTQRFRLTLPPIRMEPRRDVKPGGDPSSLTFHIAHRGYSTLFHKTEHRDNVWNRGDSSRPDVIDSCWEVKRSGAGRFGTPVAVEDPNR